MGIRLPQNQKEKFSSDELEVLALAVNFTLASAQTQKHSPKDHEILRTLQGRLDHFVNERPEVEDVIDRCGNCGVDLSKENHREDC